MNLEYWNHSHVGAMSWAAQPLLASSHTSLAGSFGSDPSPSDSEVSYQLLSLRHKALPLSLSESLFFQVEDSDSPTNHCASPPPSLPPFLLLSLSNSLTPLSLYSHPSLVIQGRPGCLQAWMTYLLPSVFRDSRCLPTSITALFRHLSRRVRAWLVRPSQVSRYISLFGGS